MSSSLGAVLLASLAFVPPAYAQVDAFPATSQQYRWGRIVYPVQEHAELGGRAGFESIDSIIGALATRPQFPGLPPTARFDDRVTISFAVAEAKVGIEGWSRPEQALIVLPLDRFLAWDDDRLGRVLRHEYAHIRMHAFLGLDDPPQWLQEGFAEWAAGGLTCQSAWRLWFDARQRSDSERSPPLSDLWRKYPDRLAYDYSASFFEFLEAKRPGFVSGGSLMKAIRDYGLASAFAAVWGAELEVAEDDWRRYLADRFEEEPDRRGCNEALVVGQRGAVRPAENKRQEPGRPRAPSAVGGPALQPISISSG